MSTFAAFGYCPPTFKRETPPIRELSEVIADRRRKAEPKSQPTTVERRIQFAIRFRYMSDQAKAALSDLQLSRGIKDCAVLFHYEAEGASGVLSRLPGGIELRKSSIHNLARTLGVRYDAHKGVRRGGRPGQSTETHRHIVELVRRYYPSEGAAGVQARQTTGNPVSKRYVHNVAARAGVKRLK